MTRMKMMLALTCVLTISTITQAQKDYVWCPNEISVSPSNTLFKDKKVSIVVHDSRVLSKDAKNKCTREELLTAISDVVKQVAPNAEYVTEGENIKIEIWVKAYSATFTSPVWFASTGITIKIFEEGTEKATKDFETSEKFFNVGGMSTAKNNLNKSYKAVVSEFITYLNTL